MNDNVEIAFLIFPVGVTSNFMTRVTTRRRRHFFYCSLYPTTAGIDLESPHHVTFYNNSEVSSLPGAYYIFLNCT